MENLTKQYLRDLSKKYKLIWLLIIIALVWFGLSIILDKGDGIFIQRSGSIFALIGAVIEYVINKHIYNIYDKYAYACAYKNAEFERSENFIKNYFKGTDEELSKIKMGNLSKMIEASYPHLRYLNIDIKDIRKYKQDFEENNKKLINSYSFIAFVYIIFGTIIWGYGDLLFTYFFLKV